VDSNAPLQRLLDTVCRWNIHRVPLLDKDGDFYGIVSQSDLLRYVSDNLSTLFSSLTNVSLEGEKVGECVIKRNKAIQLAISKTTIKQKQLTLILYRNMG
jgi:signal-transduction protein with cAMP-binding, CBS, and nucleotidyltransferase domain